jgi:hypothetical protein
VTFSPFTPNPVSALWLPSDHGLIDWSYDPALGSTPTAPAVAGTMQTVALKVLTAQPVTNILLFVGTAGVTLTAGQCFAALYQGYGGPLVGVTADQSGAWQSTGLKTMPLAGGPFTVQPGLLIVGFWYNGTTAPQFPRGDNSGAKINAGLALASSRFGTANTALTTTAPGNLGAIAAQGIGWWAALS